MKTFYVFFTEGGDPAELKLSIKSATREDVEVEFDKKVKVMFPYHETFKIQRVCEYTVNGGVFHMKEAS